MEDISGGGKGKEAESEGQGERKGGEHFSELRGAGVGSRLRA
jgi:hypothetical protein